MYTHNATEDVFKIGEHTQWQHVLFSCFWESIFKNRSELLMLIKLHQHIEYTEEKKCRYLSGLSMVLKRPDPDIGLRSRSVVSSATTFIPVHFTLFERNGIDSPPPSVVDVRAGRETPLSSRWGGGGSRPFRSTRATTATPATARSSTRPSTATALRRCTGPSRRRRRAALPYRRWTHAPRYEFVGRWGVEEWGVGVQWRGVCCVVRDSVEWVCGC